jgi:DNA-binding response OmpR family regulator
VRRRKRAEARAERGPLMVGEVEIRPDQFQAFVGGVSVDLTRREFELIQLLADARGQVLQREEIYQRVWGYAMVHGDRSVDVFVRKLRQKLERVSPQWRYIHTHFGIGYRFAAEPVEAVAEAGAGVDAPEALAAIEEPASPLADEALAALVTRA